MSGRVADDIDHDYATAGFGNELGYGRKPALIIVDFVNAYLDKQSPLYAGVEKILAVNIDLLAHARAAHIPVVFTGVRYTAGGKDGGLFYKKIKALSCFDAGNPWGNFPDTLSPAADELVVIKQYASAFFGTSLASSLRAQGVDTCLITGLSTSGCVRATALDALQHGFIPVVIEDACGDRDQRIHNSNIFDLKAKYADVVSSDSVKRYLASLNTPAP
jgi:maleamate amidohydrolase